MLGISLTSLAVGMGGGAAGPSMSLDFTTATLDSRVSATGGANGSRTNSAGALVAATAPRFDYSPTAIGTIMGLLVEEGSTNLFLNSVLAGTNLSTQSVTVTATAYTISFYGTGSITLSGAATATINGSGAYPTRVTSTFTPSAGSLTCTVSGTVQYAQIENKSFATSFIPTAGATVTRTADICAMTGTNFTNWYNASTGTFIVEATLPSAISALRFLASNTGGSSGGFVNSSSSLRAGLGGGSDAGTANTVSYGVSNKFAIAYDGTDKAIACLNGGAVATGTSDWSTGGTALYLGTRLGGIQSLNGIIRTLTFYNTRLSNAGLQALTT